MKTSENANADANSEKEEVKKSALEYILSLHEEHGRIQVRNQLKMMIV